jgi:hypothetical protein
MRLEAPKARRCLTQNLRIKTNTALAVLGGSVAGSVHLMRIATGEIDESFPADDGRNKAAQELGRMGGKARAAIVSPA